jgi:hypothetical protein
MREVALSSDENAMEPQAADAQRGQTFGPSFSPGATSLVVLGLEGSLTPAATMSDFWRPADEF